MRRLFRWWVKYVEAIAVMAKYTPFFEKAGMTEVPEALKRKDKKYFIWVNTH